MRPLAAQVKHVREQNESNALNHIVDSQNDFAGRIAESESLADVVTRGRASYSSLSEEEKLRFSAIHYVFLNNLESWYLQHRQIYGISKAASVENIKVNITAFCDNPGFREFWLETRPLYPHFAELVDQSLESSGK